MTSLNLFKPQNISESQSELLEPGKNKISFNALEQKQWAVNVDTILKALKEQMITYFHHNDKKKLVKIKQKIQYVLPKEVV